MRHVKSVISRARLFTFEMWSTRTVAHTIHEKLGHGLQHKSQSEWAANRVVSLKAADPVQFSFTLPNPDDDF